MNSYNLIVKNENGQPVSGVLVWVAPNGQVIDGTETGFTSPFTFGAEAATVKVRIQVDGYLAVDAQLIPGPNTVNLAPYEPYTGATATDCKGHFRKLVNGKCVTQWGQLIYAVVMLILIIWALNYFIKH